MEDRRLSLGAPLALGSATLRNRLVGTAHSSGIVGDGIPEPADAEYWGRLAAGGAALLICGGTVVAPESAPRRGNFVQAWRPEVVEPLRVRVQAIHDGGALAVCQLVHLGRETLGMESFHAPVGASAARSPREPTSPALLDPDAVVSSFRECIANALVAGFDGIELHAAHGYLLEQLLSARTNPAGGGVGVLERILASVRELAPSALVGVRFSVDASEDVALTGEELAGTLAAVDPVVDYVNLTVGVRSTYVRDMGTRRPPLLDDIAGLRTLTARPLVVSQAFRDAPDMVAALAAGADLVGLTRALIADPDLPRKVLGGRSSDVRPCVACNEDCRAFEPVVLCAVNPDLAPPGRTRRPARPQVLRWEAERLGDARAAVVGGGPGGLECALHLAEGGIQVVLFEVASRLGGQLAVAADAPHRSGWADLVAYYERALEHAGAAVRLGRAASPLELDAFDAVVLAPGAAEVSSLIDAGATSSTDAIEGGAGGLAGVARLVVVDDGFGWWPAINVVELAVEAGVQHVALLSPGTAFAGGIPAESRTQLLGRLRGACDLEFVALCTATAVSAPVLAAPAARAAPPSRPAPRCHPRPPPRRPGPSFGGDLRIRSGSHRAPYTRASCASSPGTITRRRYRRRRPAIARKGDSPPERVCSAS